MGFLDFLKRLGLLFNKKKDSGDEYQRVMAERSALKDEIRETLKAQLNFTELEIKEVLLIVDDVEREIQILKSKLVGSNLRMEDPSDYISHIEEQISKKNKQMREDLSKKVKEIMARRKTQS